MSEQDLNTSTEVQVANSAHAVLGAIFDLGTVADVETAEIQLKRNNVPLPIFVTFAGPEHPKRKAFALQKQRAVRKQLQKTGQMVLGDPTEDEEEANSLMADCAVSWRTEAKNESGEKVSVPYVVFNGENFACDRGNIARLINDPKRAWFRKAMKEAFDDGEAFIVASSQG